MTRPDIEPVPHTDASTARWSHAALGLRLLALASMLDAAGRTVGILLGYDGLRRVRASEVVPAWAMAAGQTTAVVVAIAGLVGMAGATLFARVPRDSGASESARASFVALALANLLGATSIWIVRQAVLTTGRQHGQNVQALSTICALAGGVASAASLIFMLVALVRAVRNVGGTPARWTVALAVATLAWHMVDFALPAVAAVWMLTRPAAGWALVYGRCTVALALGTMLAVLLWRGAKAITPARP